MYALRWIRQKMQSSSLIRHVPHHAWPRAASSQCVIKAMMLIVDESHYSCENVPFAIVGVRIFKALDVAVLRCTEARGCVPRTVILVQVLEELQLVEARGLSAVVVTSHPKHNDRIYVTQGLGAAEPRDQRAQVSRELEPVVTPQCLCGRRGPRPNRKRIRPFPCAYVRHSMSAGHFGRAPGPRNARDMRLPQTVSVPVEGGCRAQVQFFFSFFRLEWPTPTAGLHEIFAAILKVDRHSEGLPSRKFYETRDRTRSKQA